MFLQPCDEAEIITIVKQMSSNKAAGFDDISPNVIKSIIPSLIQLLTYICNLSFSTGKFHDTLKIAKVTPVFKSDNRLLVNNYRPISVLPVFSKIFEKLMYNRMFEFINQHAILTEHQYGFREHHSTYMALLKLIDKVAHELDNKSYSLGIFLDLSKAFDTLNHNILIKKLECYGLCGIVLI